VVKKLKGIHQFKVSKSKTTFEVEPKNLPEITKKIAELNVTYITSHPPKLEELFLRHYDNNSKNKES